MLLQPNAVPAATGVKTARPAKLTGTALMSGLLNVVLAIPVSTTAVLGQKAAFPAPAIMSQHASLLQNAGLVVMSADTTPIVMQQTNLVLMVVLLTILAASVQVVIPNRRFRAQNITPMFPDV